VAECDGLGGGGHGDGRGPQAGAADRLGKQDAAAQRGETPPAPIAVHLERAYDPETKTWRLDAWVTVDSSAITSGFLARISDSEWKALCLDALQAAETAYQAVAGGLGK